MDPPSYEEASLQPLAQGPGGFHSPPLPSYDASLSSPPTPPPTYREAVVLAVPAVAHVTVPQQNNGNVIHPTTEVVLNQSITMTQRSPVVIYQPQPQPAARVIPSHLTDSPGQVLCPHCRRTVTTKITTVPSRAAWGICIMVASVGLVCGFCLIPLCVPHLQDAHHSCPDCKKKIHVYKR